MGHVLCVFLKSNFNNKMEVFNLKIGNLVKMIKHCQIRVNLRGPIFVRLCPFQILEKIPKMKGFYKEMDHKWKAFFTLFECFACIACCQHGKTLMCTTNMFYIFRLRPKKLNQKPLVIPGGNPYLIPLNGPWCTLDLE